MYNFFFFALVSETINIVCTTYIVKFYEYIVIQIKKKTIFCFYVIVLFKKYFDE